MIGVDLGIWRGQAASFNPLSLSPALWLDASDSSTLFQSNGGAAAAADGDPVGYWLDKSGNNRHATQTSGSNKPLLKTAIKNGKNIVRANGTSSYCSVSFPFVAASTSYIVYKKSSSTVSFVGLGDATGGLVVNETYFSNKFLYGVRSASGVTNNSWYSTAIVDDYSSFVLIDQASDGSTVDVLKNNSSVATRNNATLTFTPTFTRLFFGDSVWANGDLCEILIFNTPHTSAQRTSVRNYLNSKWAVY